MAFVIDNLAEAIRSSKKALREALPNRAEVFRQVEAEMRQRVNAVVKERESGEPVIPIVHYSEVQAGIVPAKLIAKIQDRGACVIRNTFAREQAEAWDSEIAQYVDKNGLDAKL